MHKKIICMILWFMMTAAIAGADTLESEKDLKPFTDKVMELASKREMKKAFDTMKPYVVISDMELQTALKRAETQREQLTQRFGGPAGYEFIGEKKAGTSIVRLTYIEKTDRSALVWIFYFYRARKGWTLNSFIWNEDMPLIFQLD